MIYERKFTRIQGCSNTSVIDGLWCGFAESIFITKSLAVVEIDFHSEASNCNEFKAFLFIEDISWRTQPNLLKFGHALSNFAVLYPSPETADDRTATHAAWLLHPKHHSLFHISDASPPQAPYSADNRRGLQCKRTEHLKYDPCWYN